MNKEISIPEFAEHWEKDRKRKSRDQNDARNGRASRDDLNDPAGAIRWNDDRYCDLSCIDCEGGPVVMTELKKFRLKRKLTQEEMAEKIGVSISYYRKIEQGYYEPSYQFLRNVKETFPNVSIDKLFFGRK